MRVAKSEDGEAFAVEIDNPGLPTPVKLDVQVIEADQCTSVNYLLPTPTVMDMGANYTPQEWDAWKAKQRAAHQNGNGHGASLTQEAISLLPTPKAGDGERGRDLPRMREDTKSRELATAVTHLLPTPRASDGPDPSSHARTWSTTDRSLHTVVHLGEIGPASTGASTPPRSPAGSESSDAPHPAPPSPARPDDPDCLPFSWSG
jgi:DNA (cytosine-5)-methyltransferase 1